MTKFFNKFKKLCFLAIFGPNQIFPKSLALSCTTLYGFLGPCQNLEKTSDAIRRQFLDRRKDGRTDRPYFIKAFQLLPGVQ